MKGLQTAAIAAISVLAQIATAPARAVNFDTELGNIQVHGFATQTVLYSDENNFFGDSQDVSFDFRELGLNGLWQINPRLKFAAQILARDAGATDDGDLRVDYAFLDYNFWQGETNSAGIRLGRLINPYGMYNDTRDVVHTRPSILLPQSIYFDVNRNLALSSDGGSLYFQQDLGNNGFNFELLSVKPRTRDPDLEPAIFFSDNPGQLEGEKSTWFARGVYSYDLDRVRAGIAAGSIDVKYEPGMNDPIQSAGFNFKPLLVFGQYNSEKWSITGEFAVRRLQVYASVLPADIKTTGHSYFLQYDYRLAPGWEAFIRYDDLTWNNDDKDGKLFSAATGLPAHSRYAKDWAVGLRWDVTDKFMLRAEMHDVKGTGWLSSLENANPLATKENWKLFALSASYRF
ncbi:hypothetical protein [Pseudoteredinibacter isoporae]|uniref:Porin n=1 Tax=Pseudoteredinibacter isoporae TaxID=570281 RepID=A0A7X0JWG5_9GAMM|nr:hypothetical protein [Pseudoteredinibacter isoporae]MBB6522775.1 hypothetical protein [Pseudoteredinibacter isoporae]NHO88303.1 hypothetical protein [Pseudoteredinibacter isoporae]NIB23366.1 hypothetical protein [Pseudoteredinibacter isoporae]